MQSFLYRGTLRACFIALPYACISFYHFVGQFCYEKGICYQRVLNGKIELHLKTLCDFIVFYYP